jgi:excisionase family DNA binding protein
MAAKQPILKRLLKTQEAADYLSISPWMLRQLVSNEQLSVVRIGAALRFDIRDLDAYVSRQKQLTTGESA